MKNDIHILWVSKYRYLPDSKVARHTHTFYHYLYMAKGSGHIRLEQESMELETGTIYLIPPYVDHEFVSGKAAGMTSYEIKFEINAEGLKKQIDRLPLYLKTQDDQILNLMDKMVKETDYKLDMHEEMTALLFSELIILLQRCSDRHEFFVNDEQSNGANHEFDEILMYMRSHIHKRIKLEDLAKKMCLEKTYFVKKFKKEFGVSPIKYLNDLRLQKARDLLQYSDMNITQIASAAGFSSIHYFSRVFLNTIHTSPAKYRTSWSKQRKGL